MELDDPISQPPPGASWAALRRTSARCSRGTRDEGSLQIDVACHRQAMSPGALDGHNVVEGRLEGVNGIKAALDQVGQELGQIAIAVQADREAGW